MAARSQTGLEQALLRCEVPIDEGRVDVGFVGDLSDGRGRVAVGGEEAGGCVQQPLPGPGCVSRPCLAAAIAALLVVETGVGGWQVWLSRNSLCPRPLCPGVAELK